MGDGPLTASFGWSRQLQVMAGTRRMTSACARGSSLPDHAGLRTRRSPRDSFGAGLRTLATWIRRMDAYMRIVVRRPTARTGNPIQMATLGRCHPAPSWSSAHANGAGWCIPMRGIPWSINNIRLFSWGNVPDPCTGRKVAFRSGCVRRKTSSDARLRSSGLLLSTSCSGHSWKEKSCHIVPSEMSSLIARFPQC
jgi:hypothetical protein